MLTRLKEALNGIVQQQKANAQARDNLHTYKDAVLRMLGDLHPDPQKVAALPGIQRTFALEPQKVARVHHDVFCELARHVLAQDAITGEELDGLAAVGTILGVAWSDLPPRQLHAFQVAGTIIGIQRGQLPILPPNQTRIIAQAGETVHAEMGCQLLDERVYREYVSGSHGYSMKIAKSVYYHVGATRGRSIPHTEIVPVDIGVLSITSQRIAFVGTRQNVNSPWSRVLHAEPMSDGLALGFTNRKKTTLLKYQDSSWSEVIAALIGHYIA